MTRWVWKSEACLMCGWKACVCDTLLLFQCYENVRNMLENCDTITDNNYFVERNKTCSMPPGRGSTLCLPTLKFEYVPWRRFEYYLPAVQTFRVHWTFSLSAEPIEFQSYYDSPASSEKNGSPGFVGEVKKRFNDHLFITMTKCCFAVNYKGFV